MYVHSRFLLILLYIITINVFSAFIALLYFYKELCLFNCVLEEVIFDYIIVGFGTAGGLIANRLSENYKTKVLVLEAGQTGNALLDIPSVGLLLQKTAYDWQYQTVPQINACQALDNNVSRWPMGKIVGGTSMLNNMIYMRGHEKDFDEWFTDKEDYSNYAEDVLPFFKKLENHFEDSSVSKGGVFISDLSFTSFLPQYIFNAVKSLGFSWSKDAINCKEGIGNVKANIHKGQRWTSAHTTNAHQRTNLVLRSGAIVEKVLLKNDFEAYGVRYLHMKKRYTAKAKKSIILSAGVIGSAKLLMLSGIGQKDDLEKIGIKSKVHLPVGENLQDHITSGFDLILLNTTLDLGVSQMFSPISAFKYFVYGDGPWTTTGCEAVAFFNTSYIHEQSHQHTSLEQPDLQLMIMPLAIKEDCGVYLRRLIGISDHSWYNYFALTHETPAITILPILLHPKSRGNVKLKDKNWNSSPVIDPKYLNHSDDIDVLVKGIEFVKRIIKTESMQKLGARLNKNVFPGCESFKFDTKPYWECYVRHMTITSYHPIGTCKMGHESDNSTVTNFDFQVKNTNKLYVVDGSVMPKLTSGNINGAILMLAEMASEVIKKRDFFSSGKCSLWCLFLKSVCC